MEVVIEGPEEDVAHEDEAEVHEEDDGQEMSELRSRRDLHHIVMTNI